MTYTPETLAKPKLSFWQIVNMNAGFFGIQFSFGLEQSSMSPIYGCLGAHLDQLPYLWLAGPIAGLVVQPIIGAMSDRTLSKWGRRTPYFLIGALIGSLGLFSMPFSQFVWMAFSIQWILDVANNVTMEPYRAFVSDKLDSSQHSIGFLTQSAFTGLGQTLAYLTPTILVFFGLNKDRVTAHGIPFFTLAAFIIGAATLLVTVLWSVRTTPELPLSEEEKMRIRQSPGGVGHLFKEIADALRDMPVTMKHLAVVYLFQWYAMFCYWQYIVDSLASTVFGGAEKTAALHDATLLNGKVGGFYNFVAFVAAFAMVTVVRKLGPKITHSLCLVAAGAGMICLPLIHSQLLLLVPMVGIGIAWASIMGNPYSILVASLPTHRMGVYMGIFNMFICLPMIIQGFTLPLFYNTLLGGNPQNVIRLAGVLLLCSAVAILFVRVVKQKLTASA
jgi:maltose/moltooligosaccharide transporter